MSQDPAPAQDAAAAADGGTPPRVCFRGTLEQHGRTATGFVVPDEVVAQLGTSRRPAVRVTVNGHTYRSSVASMGGRFLLGVSAEQRGLAGVAAGDEVDVDLELDTQPREVEVPEDLRTALEADEQARQFFKGLSYSQQRWFVDGVEQAKKPETPQRRVVAAIERMREGRAQR